MHSTHLIALHYTRLQLQLHMQLQLYITHNYATLITLHHTTLHYATLRYTNYNYSYNYNYTTSHYTTLDYTTLGYTTLDYTTAQYITLYFIPLHSLHHNTTTTSTPLQLQLQLPYTTLHPGVVSEVTIASIATTPKSTTPTTFLSISGFALPSMHHNNNSPLL